MIKGGAFKLIFKISFILQYIHSADIIHRVSILFDIKPVSVHVNISRREQNRCRIDLKIVEVFITVDVWVKSKDVHLSMLY